MFAACTISGVCIFNTPLNNKETTYRLNENVDTSCADWNHNGQVLATCGGDAKIRLTYLSSRKTIATLSSDDNSPINSLSFSIGSRFLCSGGNDGYVKLWDLKKQKLVRRMGGGSSSIDDDDDDGGVGDKTRVGGRGRRRRRRRPVRCVQFNAKDTHVAVGHEGGEMNIISVLQSTAVESLRPAGDVIAANVVRHSPMIPSAVATAYQDGSVFVWDTKRGRAIVSEYGAHSGSSCEGVCFSESNRRVLRSAGGNEILTLDMGDAGVTNRVEVKGKSFTSICSSGERDEVVLVGTDKGEVLTIDLRMGGVVQSTMSVSSSSQGGRGGGGGHVRWISRRRRRGSGKGSRGRTTTKTKVVTKKLQQQEDDVVKKKKKRAVLKETPEHRETQQQQQQKNIVEQERIAKRKEEEMKIKEEEERKRKVSAELKRRAEKENDELSKKIVNSSSKMKISTTTSSSSTTTQQKDNQQRNISWSVEYLQDKIDERMEMMEERHHDDVRELSLEMVRQLQIQEGKIVDQFENMKLWMKNLMDENRELREELETLKHVH